MAKPETSGKPPVQITIHVNEQPLTMASHDATGLQIKKAAIAAGVRIQEDFILVEELGQGGHTKIIGDTDVVHLNDHATFTANDGDDDS